MLDLKTTCIQITPSCTNFLIESHYTTIKGTLEKKQNPISQHALQNFFQELERPKFQNITKANCRCKLHRICGLACAYEIFAYYNMGRKIPLESIY
uniref:Uncharacterized protein n=1 Tax=Lactuca sativa TaxID=4236 RepID=A0A9R1XQN2_LACSA|nr:hypothetical protein LSAT_V11C300138130 [Lactuca sativa]